MVLNLEGSGLWYATRICPKSCAFSAFINDIAEGLSNCIVKFADDIQDTWITHQRL